MAEFVPEIMTELRKDIVRVPEVISQASGILQRILRLLETRMRMQ